MIIFFLIICSKSKDRQQSAYPKMDITSRFWDILPV